MSVSVIMTCKNEEENIKRSLTSLERQTVKPNEVVIIDDGSTDKTYELVQEISIRNGWTLHRRKGNDDRYWSIVNAMKNASTFLKQDYEYLMVLDADTILESQYLEKILQKFKENPRLGIAGGILTYGNSISNEFLNETQIVFGSNRIYSKDCWDEINEGKIMKVHSIAWDPEHSVRAFVRGYIVKRFDDITSESIRPPSLKTTPFVKGQLRYQFGYSFLTTMISALYNQNFRILSGFMSAWINKKEKIDDKNNMKKIKNHNNKEFLKKSFEKLSNL